MATPSPDLDSLSYRSLSTTQDTHHAAPSPPPASPGNAKQTRRLQLRNAGFRGAAVPARKITPKAMSSSSWSSVSGVNPTSDIENTSPVATRSTTPSIETRASSGVLQEIGNHTLTRRPKKARCRLSSRSFEPESAAQDGVYGTLSTSPPPPKGHARRHSAKSKPKHVSVKRRSLSAEASRYIEHLEAELASAQSELSSMTSAGVSKEQSSKMRTLTAESKKLQNSLAEWESKYEQRVQEEVDRHLTIESDLKAQIRHLEQDADDTKFRIQDLETQLETTAQNMQAVETANVSLEKRLEVMTELLASTKVDLHADTPGRAKRQSRPKPMLPRFPTASSLMTSPERQARTQPTSPLASFTTTGMNMLQSPRHSIISLNGSIEHADFMSEAGSIFSEGSTTGDSMTSAETSETHQPNYNPWNLPSRRNSTTKPARRMRRFGAGSLGPKPLILPSSSQCEYFPPASAPPLEHSKISPAFFERRRRDVNAELESPITARRRASTIANVATETTRSARVVSPFLDIAEQAYVEDTLASLSPPPSSGSYATTRRHSSLEVGIGRNLMEELTAARSIETTSSTEEPTTSGQGEDTAADIESLSGLESIEPDVLSPASDTFDLSAASPSTDPESTQTSTVTTKPTHRRTRSRGISIAASRSDSMLGRIRLLFGDLWRSPIVMARYLIQTAQARMSIPRPLMNVQWWLVGVLFGPMAKRHVLGRSAHSSKSMNERQRLLENPPGEAHHGDDTSCYDSTLSSTNTSPTLSPEPMKHSSKKRGRNKIRCVHRRVKHSPWLWLKFSLTLAFAIGTAFKDGPGSLLKASVCHCRRRDVAKSLSSQSEEPKTLS